MSVKSVGYKHITLTEGTYTQAALTLSPSLQILEIKSQTITVDGDLQDEYDTLEENYEDLNTSVDTIQATLKTIDETLADIDLDVATENYNTLLENYNTLLTSYDAVVKRPTIQVYKTFASSELLPFVSSSASVEQVLSPVFSIVPGTYIAHISINGTAGSQSGENVTISVGLKGSADTPPNQTIVQNGACSNDQWYEYNDVYYWSCVGSFVFTVTSNFTLNFTIGFLSVTTDVVINNGLTTPNAGIADCNSANYSAVQANLPTLLANPRAIILTQLSQL
jgi:hypothetical protein